MTQRCTNTLTQSLRVTLIAGCACSMLLLQGCGGESEAKAAVQKAERSFTAVSLGDANAIPEDSARIYRDAEQSLAEHAGDSGGFAEAAAVGVAMAKRGQAWPSVAKRGLQRKMRGARLCPPSPDQQMSGGQVARAEDIPEASMSDSPHSQHRGRLGNAGNHS